ncbi:MAG TPA: DJ-1/PfpI family protein [Methylocystis sp.]
MLQIGMLIYPMMFDLDLVGPQTFFNRLGDVNVFYVGKSRAPVMSDLGVSYAAHHDFQTCPKDLDILFVPGGLKGTTATMHDGAALDFLADRGSRAGYVTSVCTGSLLLGAAGLLNGYKAAGYWMVRDLLPLFGAELVTQRVVVDRNRVTGAGVTAGLDFGLALAAELRGRELAETLQLLVEYDPQPPFSAGAPETAPAAIVDHLREMRRAELVAAREAVQSAARRLKRP